MAGQDYELFNTLERGVSADLNDQGSMKDRSLLDMLQRAFSSRTLGAGAMGVETIRNVILGGLDAVPSGNDISVNPGALVQNSATLAPVPGALDSSFRVGINRAAETVVMPAPGVETFYLVEAQMVEVTTETAIRDIFNPGLNAFVPTAGTVKKRERQLNFQVVAGVGGNYPAPTGGDWVPVCGVRRPGGGGPVAANDIDDVRMFWGDFSIPARSAYTDVFGTEWATFLRTTFVPGAAASDTLLLQAKGMQSGRKLLFDSLQLPFDPTSAVFIEPGLVLVASTWYYLYLTEWQGGITPASFYTAAQHKGVLVLSDNAPAAVGSKRTAAGLALPPPWGVAPATPNGSVLVGAVRRNGANTGWDWLQSIGDGVFLKEESSLTFAAPAATTTVSLVGVIPAGAKMAILQIGFVLAGGGSTNQLARLTPVGAAASDDWVTANFDWDTTATWHVEVPMDASQSFDVHLTGATRPSSLVIHASGFSF